MKKEFVPYELALELKELGFDEECWFYYQHNSELRISLSFLHNKFSNQMQCSSPLWQQVFDWFRNVMLLDNFITVSNFMEKHELV